MRAVLGRLYTASFALAALCFAAIGALVTLQIAGRLADRLLVAAGQPALGLAVPSIAEIGSFLFVSAAFLGAAGTLRTGGHVRVTLLTQSLPPRPARAMLAVTLTGALALAGFATWNAALQALDSLNAASVSYGMVAIPLALPQGVMALGLAIFTLAVADELVAVLAGDTPAFRAAEATRERSSGAG